MMAVFLMGTIQPVFAAVDVVSATVGLRVCGNNQIDDDEVCDGTALASQTCVTQGFLRGTLACHASCSLYVTSGCTNTPLVVTPTPVVTPSGGGGGGGGGGYFLPAPSLLPTPIIPQTSVSTSTTTVTPTSTPATLISTADQERVNVLLTLGIPVHGLFKLPNDGHLDTHEDEAVYYMGTDGKRHAFPNPKVYFSWYRDFDSVRVAELKLLSQIPLGSNVVYRAGSRLVKFETNPKVFAVEQEGVLRWVPTEAMAHTLYGPLWSRLVDDVSDAFIMDYRFGADLQEVSDFPVDLLLEMSADTDQDGLSNALEASMGTNAQSQDTDGDGLKDGEEVLVYRTDPLKKDTDGDSYPDGVEVVNGYDPLGAGKPLSTTRDSDGDGLMDADETKRGTNPFSQDSDGDTLLDGVEVNKYHTNPLKRDTDGDGYDDATEVKSGNDPLRAPVVKRAQQRATTAARKTAVYLKDRATRVLSNVTSYASR